jgi:hypothetical protein
VRRQRYQHEAPEAKKADIDAGQRGAGDKYLALVENMEMSRSMKEI